MSKRLRTKLKQKMSQTMW